jgi:integrative and conjugative element protein (TIGR02256 family)
LGKTDDHSPKGLRLREVVTWISRDAIDQLSLAASRKDPLETGGLILGYWASAREAVITEISLPGPGAAHYRYSYRPDYQHDEEVVRRIHSESHGVLTYLGDWHTHPGTKRPYLSFKDKRAVHRIANSVEARTPRPLALVCAGAGNEWRPKVWVGEEAVTVFGKRFLATIPTNLVEYS